VNTDQKLVDLYQDEQNAEALQELYARHRPFVRRIIMYQTRGPVDEHEGEAFIAFERAVSRYDANKKASIRTFIYLQVRRALINEYRREREHHRRYVTIEAPMSSFPSRAGLSKSTYDRLEAARDGVLTRPEAAVLELYFLDEIGNMMIVAERMGIARHTARKLKHAALRKLALVLGDA